MPLNPVQFGAVGDGVHDDGPALDALFAAAVATDEIDLRGTWYVGAPVTMATEALDIRAGSFVVLPGAVLSAVLVISLPTSARVSGTIRVTGTGGSWLANRTVTDGVHVHLANACAFDGFDVRYVRRHAVRTGAAPGGNVIGAELGRVRAVFCGAPGIPGAPTYTRATTTATYVERLGSGSSPAQRATIALEDDALPLEAGDYLLVGGYWTEVVAITAPGEILVYPWPGSLEGPGMWTAEGVLGSAVRVAGGNTTQLSISGIYAQYCGSPLWDTGLYGCNARSVMAEAAGPAVLGSRNTAHFGGSIVGLHGEATAGKIDVVVGGITLYGHVVVAPIQPIEPGYNAVHVVPTKADGTPAGWDWPLVTVPA